MPGKTIDAGATCFVGQGAHFPRGVEVYKGCPIFYNLGSLLMEFESGESMISPEMYETYHLGPDAHPSDLHSNRAQKPDGSWNGFYSERRFSTNFLVVLDIDEEGASYEIVPLDLDMHRENNLKRGLPEISTPEEGKSSPITLRMPANAMGFRLHTAKKQGLYRLMLKQGVSLKSSGN